MRVLDLLSSSTIRALLLQDLQSDPDTSAEAEALPAEVYCTSQTHGHSLASLPAEVLLSIVDQLGLPALACFIQTCKDVRAVCMTDAVWESICEGTLPKLPTQARKYHKLNRCTAVDVKPSVSLSGNLNATVPQEHSAKLPATSGSQPDMFSCSQVQRYSFLDSNLRLRYTGALVVEPAWLSLMPKVSCHGAGWLYVKGKTLSGLPSKISLFLASAFI